MAVKFLNPIWLLCDPTDCSLWGSSVYGISRTETLGGRDHRDYLKVHPLSSVLWPSKIYFPPACKIICTLPSCSGVSSHFSISKVQNSLSNKSGSGVNEVSGIKLSIYGRAKQKTNYLPQYTQHTAVGVTRHGSWTHRPSAGRRNAGQKGVCPQQFWTAARLGVPGFVSKAREWFCGSWLRSLASWSCPLTHPFFLKEGICLQLRSLLRLRPASRTWVFSLGLFPFYTPSVPSRLSWQCICWDNFFRNPVDLPSGVHSSGQKSHNRARWDLPSSGLLLRWLRDKHDVKPTLGLGCINSMVERVWEKVF